MTQYVEIYSWQTPKYMTLGDLIQAEYPDFEIDGGKAPMDIDITHGYEIESHDGYYGKDVTIYPYVLWTDGSYSPCHYWGEEHYIKLFKK